MTDEQRIQLEAAAFRSLVEHLRWRTDVQNIDLMNQAGFCRNCLAKWLVGAAGQDGVALDYDQARELIYGMPYDEWKGQFQLKATDEQKRRFLEETEGHTKHPG